jgi:hypothetical protein
MHPMAAFDFVLAAVPPVCIIVNPTLGFVSAGAGRRLFGNNLRCVAI